MMNMILMHLHTDWHRDRHCQCHRQMGATLPVAVQCQWQEPESASVTGNLRLLRLHSESSLVSDTGRTRCSAVRPRSPAGPRRPAAAGTGPARARGARVSDNRDLNV